MDKKIMLVEDDPKARAAMSRVLLWEGITLLSCHDAEQAMASLARGCPADAPDVAILDVRLPGIWGDEFGRRLHATHPSTRIIFVTGEQNVAARLKREVPGCTVVSKPIDPKGLLQLLA